VIIFEIINNSYYLFYNNKKDNFLIEVDISEGLIGKEGPAKFVQGLSEILPYNTGRCRFISSKNIYPINGKNKTDFFFLPVPRLNENIYYKWKKIRKANNLLLGPCFVPMLWNNFPDKKYWVERKFKQILKTIKGIIVHSNRVKNHLARKSFSIKMIKKFKIVRPCTNLKPDIIKPFNNRTIDLIFFEKYADLNRSKQGAHLLELFKNTSIKIESLKYRNYTKKK
jgi:hypothetical protein